MTVLHTKSEDREVTSVVHPALVVNHCESLFVCHRRLKAVDGGNWKTRTYGTKSFVTPSASPCPSVPSPSRLNTRGREIFRTQFSAYLQWRKMVQHMFRKHLFFKRMMLRIKYYLIIVFIGYFFSHSSPLSCNRVVL